MMDVLQVKSPMVTFHVLRDESGLYLIDTGFAGAPVLLKRALKARGWGNDRINGIILTHGHLDHALNAGRLARETGAWIAAPRMDADHYEGKPRYRGWAKVGGIMQAVGRPVLGFERFTPDRWIDDGDVIDVCGGLRAIHLPGHTAGHTGYFCGKSGVLFSADLFASYRWGTHFPPAIFNSEPEKMQASVEKVLALDLSGVLPNHGDGVRPEVHLERLRKLAGKWSFGHRRS